MPGRTVATVEIPAAGAVLRADLTADDGGGPVVVFAHGSGSSRHSPRNRLVAARLHEEGLGTLLLDLLTEEEDERDARTGELRFDVDLLAGRLVSAVEWLRSRPATAAAPFGYFGASTGAAAALIAAARHPDGIGAVVSRGGRPDLAGDSLEAVRAPTLLVVGGRDQQVLDLNRRAGEHLVAEHRLEVVSGATHLFEEPGALEQMADLAAAWFSRHLA